MTEHLIHIGYFTLHLQSGRFYIGIHSTSNPNDGYLGSGADLVKAIRANGRDQFRRIDVAWFDSRAEASAWEAAAVSPEVVRNPMSFNIATGGGNPEIPAEQPTADALPIFNATRQSLARPSPSGQGSGALAGKHLETLTASPIPDVILVPPPPSRVCIGGC